MAVQREIARTGSDGADLGRRAGVHPQTVQSFLNGRRWPALKTLGRIDVALGWPIGTLSDVAEGEYPDGLAEPVPKPVGDAVNIAGLFFFVRPLGVSDQEWECITDAAQRFIEWQLDRASTRDRRTP